MSTPTVHPSQYESIDPMGGKQIAHVATGCPSSGTHWTARRTALVAKRERRLEQRTRSEAELRQHKKRRPTQSHSTTRRGRCKNGHNILRIRAIMQHNGETSTRMVDSRCAHKGSRNRRSQQHTRVSLADTRAATFFRLLIRVYLTNQHAVADTKTATTATPSSRIGQLNFFLCSQGQSVAHTTDLTLVKFGLYDI